MISKQFNLEDEISVVPEFRSALNQIDITITEVSQFFVIRTIQYIYLATRIIFFKIFKNRIILLHETDDSPSAKMLANIGSIFKIPTIRYPKTATFEKESNISKRKTRKNEILIRFKQRNIENTSPWSEQKSVLNMVHPHLLYGWKRVVQAHTTVDQVDGTKPEIAIILSSVVKNIFDSSDFYTWCDVVFKAIKITHPDSLIKIKPHPMNTVEEVQQVIKLAEGYKIDIQFPQAHICTIVARAKLTISPVSTAALDAIFFGSDLVIFQVFSPKWLERHPEKSFLIEFGVKHTEKLSDLVSWLKSREPIEKPTKFEDQVREVAEIDFVEKLNIFKARATRRN